MSATARPRSEKPLWLSLHQETFRLTRTGTLARSGRSARTLVKDGPLRVTLVALAAGCEIAPHRAEGPVAVQTLHGSVRVRAGGEAWLLETGDLLALGAGVEHSVESDAGGVFQLTVAVPEAGRPDLPAAIAEWDAASTEIS